MFENILYIIATFRQQAIFLVQSNYSSSNNILVENGVKTKMKYSPCQFFVCFYGQTTDRLIE